MSRNGINANQQVELLCEILRVYQEHWEELPSSFARNLQQLIRLMGPNSQYTAFRENGEKRQEHSDILRQSEKIVQTLRTVCNVVPDRDAGFATLLVTYSREYYGKSGKNFISLSRRLTQKKVMKSELKSWKRPLLLQIVNWNILNEELMKCRQVSERKNTFRIRKTV